MRRCPACGFLWLQEKMLQENYYGNLDLGLDPVKAERRRRNVDDRIRIARKYMPLDHVCDVGTGDGLLLQALKKRGYPGCFGIEPSNEGVSYCLSLGLDVRQSTIADVPGIAREKEMKSVTMYHVIEHLDDPKADIQRIFDALPPGGYLLIETPDLHGYSPTMIGEQWELFYPEHLWYFDKTTLPMLLHSCGFTVTAAGPRDFDPLGKSLSELLYRLGLRKRGNAKNAAFASAGAQTERSKERLAVAKKQSLAGLILSPLRYVLAKIVQRSGRADSFWVIAQKPIP